MIVTPQFHPDRITERIHTYVFSCDMASWQYATNTAFTPDSVALLQYIRDHLVDYLREDLIYENFDTPPYGTIFYRQMVVTSIPFSALPPIVSKDPF